MIRVQDILPPPRTPPSPKKDRCCWCSRELERPTEFTPRDSIEDKYGFEFNNGTVALRCCWGCASANLIDRKFLSM